MNLWHCPACNGTEEQPEVVDQVGHHCGWPRRHRTLVLVEPPKVNIRAAIVAEATARFPEEACGFILSTGTVVMAKNVAQDPANGFIVDPNVADLWWPTGRVTGVWHSHCFDPAVPSEADQALAHPKVECWIYSVLDEQLGIYKPDKQGTLQMVSLEDVVV